jgi:lipid-binding SYLF domain-containing protein
MRMSTHATALIGVIAMLLGCSTTPKSEAKKESLQSGAQRAVDRMTAANPAIRSAIDSAHGYAVFPKIGKGGLVVGGAYGRGIVYEQGRMIGYADMTQASVGAQLGGQTYSELIAFQNQAALNRFRQNSLELAANLSAVIVKSGTARAANYENGVAVYIMPREGAMAEASVGGQKFTFVADDTAAGGTSTTRPAP